MLVLGLKECLVECATLRVKSEVMLIVAGASSPEHTVDIKTYDLEIPQPLSPITTEHAWLSFSFLLL